MRRGVCSWSLRPQHVEHLIDGIERISAGESVAIGVQLALDPLRRGEWGLRHTEASLAASGIPILSGMMEMLGEDYSSLESIRDTGGVRLDEHWPANLAAAAANAQLAEELGIPLITFHAGFLPHDSADPLRQVMIDRLRQLCQKFRDRGIQVAFETGQESAATLMEVLRDLDVDGVGVNFDPANMILYGMGSPLHALQVLSPHVLQVHVKDAVATRVPGRWGEEVTVGSGEVDFAALVGILRDNGLDVDCVLEREAGEQRVEDLRAGLGHLNGCLDGGRS